MFGLFKSPSFTDPALGLFRRSRGLWRGQMPLPGHAALPLALSGDRAGPEAQALAAAKNLGQDLPTWRVAVGQALFDHYLPYAAASAVGPLPSPLTEPGQVWPHTRFQFVAVLPLQGVMTVELGCAVAWDEEHTLGARFQQGRLIELNGSVLPP